MGLTTETAGRKRGIDFLREQRKRSGGGNFQRSGLLSMYGIKDTSLQFHFVTDGDDIHVPLIHPEEVKTKFGMRSFDRICGRVTEDEPIENCARCQEGFDGPWSRSVLLTYVHFRLWPTQADTKGNRHDDWEAVKGPSGVLYKEVIDRPALFLVRFKLEDQVMELFEGDPTDDDYADRKQTLLDRGYRLVTTGERQQRQDILRPGNPATATPEAVLEMRANPPDIVAMTNAEWGDKKSGQNAPDGVEGTTTAGPLKVDTADGAAPTTVVEPAGELEEIDF